MGGRHPWEQQSSGENLRPVMRPGPLEAEQLWGRVAPWHLPQDRWGNWGTRPNKSFPTGGLLLANSVVLIPGCMLVSPGNSDKSYAGTPLQTHHVRLLGKGAGIGICKSSRVIAMMVRRAWRPGWWAAQAGGADFPGWWGMCGLGNFITVNTAFYLDSWLWGWKYFLLKDWGFQKREASQILESFSLASLFLPGEDQIPLYSQPSSETLPPCISA